jgi:hypothetical protein
MNPLYVVVSQRAEHRCEYCRAPEVIFNCAFEVEHITPTSLGGGDDDSNLGLACRICNLRKSNRVTGVDKETKTEVSLFHPRRDQWAHHFEVESTTGQIIGLTATGRATISHLDLNSELQLQARIQWIRLGIFP